MIGQRCAALRSRPAIHDYGCYFMCLIWVAWREGGIPPDRGVDADGVIEVYDESVARGYMDEDCYVRRPADILGLLGVQAGYLGKGYHVVKAARMDATCTLDVSTACVTFQLGDEERRRWLEGDLRAIELWTMPRPGGKTWRHFVCGDYDPWVRSITRAQGTLHSLRVVRVAEAA